MLNKLKGLYDKSPSIFKKIYGSIPNEIKYGKVFRYWKRLIKKGVDIKRDPNDTVKYAVNNFTFYKNLYKNIDINDWNNIPLLNKSLIQKHLKEFESTYIKKLYVTTGGVTGKPAKFFQSNNVWYKEMAYAYSFFNQFGYKPPSLKASFRGADFSSLKKNEYWLINPHHYEINFSPFHISDITIVEYVDKLNDLKPDFFHGYPSIFLSLAKHMQDKGLKLNYTPKSFFLVSEGYNKKDIKFLQTFFNCKMRSFYGQSERIVFAIADDDLENYKADLNYGYFELVDSLGNVITECNLVGEIVATSYDNFAMPLIRYKTGDYTSYSDFENKVFKKITGKWGQLFLFGFNKEKISLTALNLHSEELDDILKMQFIQSDYGKVEVLIVFIHHKEKYFVDNIQNLLINRVGSNIDFSLRQTNDFITTSRGKSPLIINKIS